MRRATRSGYTMTLRVSGDRLRATIRIEDRILGHDRTIDLTLADDRVIDATAEIPQPAAVLLEAAGIELY